MFDRLRQWWIKKSDPRDRLVRGEQKKRDAMAKRLDVNEKKYKKPLS